MYHHYNLVVLFLDPADDEVEYDAVDDNVHMTLADVTRQLGRSRVTSRDQQQSVYYNSVEAGQNDDREVYEL